MSSCSPEIFGADPITLQWRVVRGDSASFKVEFLQENETEYFDTSTWSYSATAYDQLGDVLDELECEYSDGYVIVKADPSVTENWGNRYAGAVAELPFDVQVVIADGLDRTTWTPVIGTIYVIADVSPGGSL